MTEAEKQDYAWQEATDRIIEAINQLNDLLDEPDENAEELSENFKELSDALNKAKSIQEDANNSEPEDSENAGLMGEYLNAFNTAIELLSGVQGDSTKLDSAMLEQIKESLRAVGKIEGMI